MGGRQLTCRFANEGVSRRREEFSQPRGPGACYGQETARHVGDVSNLMMVDEVLDGREGLGGQLQGT